MNREYTKMRHDVGKKNVVNGHSKRGQNFRLFAVITLFILGIVLGIALISAAFLSFPFEVSVNIFTWKTTGDVILTALWGISGLVAIWTLFGSFSKIKRRKRGWIQHILLLYNQTVFVATLIPLFVLGAPTTVSGVQRVIDNTYLFYYLTAAFLSAGFLCTLFAIQDAIEKSNWWVFIASIPYIMTGWMVSREYGAYNHFVKSEAFRFDEVVPKLKEQGVTALVWNETWFHLFAILLLILVLLLGGILVAITWEKTASWRQGKEKV
ncbi:hypothetical protein [Listeria booriae]|uniref:hypothetical protein n=1 Tax=Listeria booriae TaxID=1552123 RepID=UPI001628DFB3|nr:hypothetical protein [Listeria booriae]MBC2173973.1 hypothetical protein [Listeria booriae]